MTETMVRVENLHYRARGKPLLNGLSFALDGTSVTVVMGPNGAGKTLLLRLLCGLEDPDQGSIQLPPKARTALVLQKPVLLRRSVRANLFHAFKVYGISRSKWSGLADELLVLGNLDERADHPARRLSGGEQQRLSLVRALAARPEILLLDEPTASLDPRSTLAIERLIRGAADQGAKIILISHNLGQAKRLADEILFLNAGKLVEQGAAQQVLENPVSSEAQAYMAGDLVL